MRRKLKEDLGHIEVELAIIRTLVTDLYDETVQRKHSSINQIRAEFGLGPLHSDPVEKAAEAIEILQEYCNSQDTCEDCVFRDCRDDCGFICKVNQLVSDERYERAVGAKMIGE